MIPNLLIVDDLDENLFFLEQVVKGLNINLIQALSGAEALELIRGIDVALAILDVRMPGMNGYELAVRMNEERTSDKIPVIFLTANPVGDLEAIEVYKSGAVDYMTKPVSVFILLSKINVFLDLHKQKQTIVRDAGLLRKSADVLTRVNAVITRAEQKYRGYVDNAPDGVFVSDENGCFVEVNPAGCRMIGYAEDEILNRSITDFLWPGSDRAGLDDLYQVRRVGSSSADLMFRHKDGSQRWWAVDTVKLSEIRFIAFVKDITGRKIIESELQASLAQKDQLTVHIQQVREEERVAIARELHDDLGQLLTAVKIDLGMLGKSVDDPKTVADIGKIGGLVGESIKTVQRITSQLRPQILDDLGLCVAIEWYATEFASRTKIDLFLDIDSGILLTPEASLVVFRIVQESLTNVARHSRATRVELTMSLEQGSICLMVRDNGIGIANSEVLSAKSFGILSMKERAVSLGGKLEVDGQSGQGTRIVLNLPCTNLKEA